MASVREDIATIVRSYGYSGEIADMLIDMFNYYVNEHLIKIAGQFYNSSTFKTQNIDAALQLSLDHSVPVSRGDNTTLLVNIYATGPLTFAPLQEIFSYGNHFFYVKSRHYIQIDTGFSYRLELAYTNKGKRILEYKLTIPEEVNQQNETENYSRRAFYNDIYIIDDTSPISNEVAIYGTYKMSDAAGNVINTNTIVLPYTKHPFQFYLFTYLENEDNYLKDLYPILVLTTPRYGINLRINHRYLISVLSQNIDLRVEYLNHTPAVPPGEILSLLIDHINQNFPVSSDSTYIEDIISYTQPHRLETIKYNVAEGTRFNGVIRSVSDFRNWLLNMTDLEIYDAQLFYHYSPTVGQNNNISHIHIKYVIVIIADIRQQGTINNFIQNHIYYIRNLMPTLSIHSVSYQFPDFTRAVISSNNINISNNNATLPNPDIIIKYAIPIRIKIQASYVGTINSSLVIRTFKDMLMRYQNKILEQIDPREFFTLFSRIGYVNYVSFFKVEVPIPRGTNTGNNDIYFLLDTTSNNNNNNVVIPIILVDKHAIFSDIINSSVYYIEDFDLIINVAV